MVLDSEVGSGVGFGGSAGSFADSSFVADIERDFADFVGFGESLFVADGENCFGFGQSYCGGSCLFGRHFEVESFYYGLD